MLLIIIQIIQVIYNIITYFIRRKKYILLNTAIASIISILMYLILGEINAIIASSAICLRNTIFVWKDKYKTNTPFYLCMSIHIITGIIALIIDTDLIIFNFIPLITSLIACFCNWYSNEQGMRISNIITNILWLIYNTYYSLYIASLLCIIHMITSYIAFIYYKKQKLTIKFIEQ